jgi:uncharacterized phage infection (PIP) family protein YhgE
LAGRSADAAKEIKSLINASVERVALGTALVDQAGATMSEVVDSIQKVTDIMAQIAMASSDQSVGVSQVAEAITHMDQVTQQNAALVEEVAMAASKLENQSQELVDTVAVFKLAGKDLMANKPRVLAAPHQHPLPDAPRPKISGISMARKPGLAVPQKAHSLANASKVPTKVDTQAAEEWEAF